MRVITPEEHWQITCHEAGHAIVAVRLQISFLYVERGGGEQGEVCVGGGPIEIPENDWTQDEISQWQQFYAAGAAGELLLFGKYREYGSRHDRVLHTKLEERRSSDRNCGWALDVQCAVKVLDRESVEVVAKELDKRKKLTEEQVCRLLGTRPSWW